MANSYQRKSKTSSNLAGFLEKYWYWVLGLIFVFPVIYNYLKGFLKGQADQKADEIAESPTLLVDAMDNVWEGSSELYANHDEATKNDCQHYAKVIYESFNIPKHWYDWFLPSTWLEDDETAFKAILASYGGINDSELHDYTAACYTLISGSAKRDLDRDIQKYLDKSYIEKLNS